MTPTASTFDLALIWLIAGWAVVALGAVVLLWALFRDRSRGRRRCPKCWYDMAGAPSLKCPECGREAKNDRALFRTRRKWRLAAVALLLVAAGFASTRMPRVLKDGIIANMPTPVLRFAAWCQQDRAQALFQTAAAPNASMFAAATRPKGGIAQEWEEVLVAWHAGRLIASKAGQSSGSPVESWQALQTEFFLIQRAGVNARVALPELIVAIESDAWAVALEHIAGLAGRGSTAAINALEQAAMSASRPEASAHAAGQLAVVVGGSPRHVHRVRRVLASELGPQVASTIARNIVPHADGAGGRPASPGHAELLNELLRDRRERVRLAGVMAARTMKNWAPIEQSLITILQEDPSRVLRHRVAEFARTGSVLTTTWGLPLVRACEDPDIDVRLAAIETLLSWAESPRWPIGSFSEWLAVRESESPAGGASRRDTFAWIRERAVRDSSMSTSVRTVRLLHRFDPDHPDLLPTYLNWARHQAVPMARAAAIEALAEFPVTTVDIAVDLLSDVLKAESNGWVRTVSLRELPLVAPDDPRVLDLLSDSLADEERDVRMMATLMLGVLAKPHERAETRLQEIVSTSDIALVQIAKSSLEAMRSGTSNSSAVPWGPMAAPSAPAQSE